MGAGRPPKWFSGFLAAEKIAKILYLSCEADAESDNAVLAQDLMFGPARACTS